MPPILPQEIGYEDLLDLLPDEIDPGDHRRKFNLTRNDLLLIGKLIEAKSGHQVCQQFTQEEIVIGKKVLKMVNKAASVVGMAILVAFVGGAIALFSKGFWRQLGESLVK